LTLNLNASRASSSLKKTLWNGRHLFFPESSSGVKEILFRWRFSYRRLMRLECVNNDYFVFGNALILGDE
jgi:hypothetical protein